MTKATTNAVGWDLGAFKQHTAVRVGA